MSRKTPGSRAVRSLKAGRTIRDAAVAGFGARRQQSQSVSYVLFYRTEDGRQRWYTIGRHGSPWAPDKARTEAQRLLGEVKKGSDPAVTKRSKRQAATV